MMVHFLIILISMLYVISKWEVPTTVLEEEEIIDSYQGTVQLNNLEIVKSAQEEQDTTEVEIAVDTENETQTQELNKTTIEWSEKEYYELAKIVECEAGNQNIQTKILVIMVVLNRVQSEEFPDTIHDVIFEEHDGIYQFTPLQKSGSWWYKEPSDDAYEAVSVCKEQLENGYDNSGGALYFESFKTDKESEQSWHGRNLQFLYKSQNMRFYK